MQSKTSFFNKTVFKKNLTRFAPVWVLYTLLLCVYLVMFYVNEVGSSEYNKLLGFAWNFSWGMIEVFMFWNLAYALLTAQLLFGDLFNSRMCNALHAMPLRRETWFVTNCLSGLTFSVVPTFIATLVLLPMMMVSIVENAWAIALLWFLTTNLQYICCFGIAAFAAMCVGSRLTMAAGYGLIHFGSYIAYWLVDTVYTPMLYGVYTPTTLVTNLSPTAQMVEYQYLEIPDMIHEYNLREMGLTVKDLADMTIPFTLTEHWWRLFAIAGAGLVFAALAVLLYRKRDLECAGDAVAFPVLKPVFQVLCSLFVMCAGQFVVSNILGMREFAIPIMAICLVVGWFIGKMLIEHSTRVFRLKNWYGLGLLTACMALTLVATHFDILNIEERLPDLNKVETVRFETNRTRGYDIPEEDWEAVRRVHELAVRDRVEDEGLYIIQEDGTRVLYTSQMDMPASDLYIDPKTNLNIEEMLGYDGYTKAGNVRIIYTFEDGSTMQRRYNVWSDGEIGELTRKTLSAWDILTVEKAVINGETVPTLDAALDTFQRLAVTGNSYKEMPEVTGKADALTFLDAVKADCKAGLMIQDDNFHRGVFSRKVEDSYTGETYLDTRSSIYVSYEGRETAWDVRVYPDCVNTMNWLKERDLIIYDVYPDAIALPG